MIPNRLEYRLFDEKNNYPALYYYEELTIGEIFARRECKYYIKNNKIYTKTSSAYEAETFVIYLSEDHDESLFQNAPTYEYVTLEIREWKQFVDSPVLKTIDCSNHEEVFGYLGSDYLFFDYSEHEKMATEIDEDRRAYVLYVQPTSKQS